jgi:hypothetical protein
MFGYENYSSHTTMLTNAKKKPIYFYVSKYKIPKIVKTKNLMYF